MSAFTLDSVLKELRACKHSCVPLCGRLGKAKLLLLRSHHCGCCCSCCGAAAGATIMFVLCVYVHVCVCLCMYANVYEHSDVADSALLVARISLTSLVCFPLSLLLPLLLLFFAVHYLLLYLCLFFAGLALSCLPDLLCV